MNYAINLPTTVYFENECICNHNNIFPAFGKNAMIVTGKNSARLSGALDDVIKSLLLHTISYIVFDEIENNPSLETVEKGGQIARNNGIDMVIGIGGGSPIDAAKAIAVLAVNEINALDLFKNDFDQVLPIIAIPTTAGTGSEVTPYSVLVRNDLNTKVSFGNQKTFPTYALLDAKYTDNIGIDITINTAVDAFTHALEGYLCNRATSFTDALAIDAIQKFGECISSLKKETISLEVREKLLYVSFIGGLVIAHTGVTIVHGMGYCYTYFKNIPHGKANGYLVGSYLNLIHSSCKEKIAHVLQALGYESIADFVTELEALIGLPPQLSQEEVENYTKLTLLQKGSISNTAKELNEEELKEIWKIMSLA